MIYLNTHTDRLPLQEVLTRLNPIMQQRVTRYKQVADQRRSAAAYLMLSEHLNRDYEVSELSKLLLDEHGKPYLPECEDVFFSLSHSGNAAICGVDEEPIGVDIEDIRTFNTDYLAEMVVMTMNEDEQFDIGNHIDFLTLWTQKEAVLKLTGEGIRDDMRDVLEEARNIQVYSAMIDNRYIYSVAQYKKGNVV